MDLFRPASAYVIDTCSIIDLRMWYPTSIAKAVWDALGELMDERVVASVDEVWEELKVQEDRVSEWAKRHRDAFLPLNTDIQRATKKVLKDFPDLIDHKKRKSSADPFVIGAAQCLEAAVVTEEKPSAGGARPKVPNVCRELDLECIRLVELFEREGFQFVLSHGAGRVDEPNDFQ